MNEHAKRVESEKLAEVGRRCKAIGDESARKLAKAARDRAWRQATAKRTK